MMDNIELSYVLTTFNKISYLRVTLPLLIESCKDNEEIIVIDGDSNDGSRQYLEELFLTKKIHQFISEKDFGESNGYNKAILLARGKLLKIISDDDIYDFNEIRKCKKFMLENNEFDVLASNTIQVNLLNKNSIICNFSKNLELDFIDWANGQRSNTFFCGLTLMIRKSSLPLIGLFSCYFKMIDVEYCVRITSLNTKIAYYTNPLVVSTVNLSSNSRLFFEKHEKELLKVSFSYEYFNTYLSNQTYYNPYSLKSSVKYLIKLMSSKFLVKEKKKDQTSIINSDIFKNVDPKNFEEVAGVCVKLMNQYNKSNNGIFIEKR